MDHMASNVTKMCQVYFLEDGSALVEGLDFEPTGPGGLPSKVMARISREALLPLLGMVVLAILDQTRVIRGADHDEKEVMAVRASMSGIKARRSFELQAKALAVTLEGAEVEVIPTGYRSDHGGWRPYIPEKAGKCPPMSDAVGDLLLAKLAECE